MYNFEALIVGLRAEWELRSQVSSWLFSWEKDWYVQVGNDW